MQACARYAQHRAQARLGEGDQQAGCLEMAGGERAGAVLRPGLQASSGVIQLLQLEPAAPPLCLSKTADDRCNLATQLNPQLPRAPADAGGQSRQLHDSVCLLARCA